MNELMAYNKVQRQHAEDAPQMTYDELHAVAQYLYQLLDDIDTAGDMAKGDDKLFRAIVERTQTKKCAVVAECDGYTVTLKPLPANVIYPERASSAIEP